VTLCDAARIKSPISDLSVPEIACLDRHRKFESKFPLPIISRRSTLLIMIPIRHRVLATSLRRPVIDLTRYSRVPALRFYSASLAPGEYHRLADETMDRLTSELETLLEDNDLPGSDVEYSVLASYLRYC